MSNIKDNLLKKYPSRLSSCIWRFRKGKIELSYCPSRKKPSLLTLKGIKADLWSRLDGKKSIEDIEKYLGNGLAYQEVIRGMQYFLNKGLINMNELPVKELEAKDKKSIYYLEIAKLIKAEALSTKFLKKQETDASRYHIETIKDPQRQFNQIEATVSHSFYKAHPALGVPYGVRFGEELEKIKPLFKGAQILEVGGGIGWLAKRFLDDLRKRNYSVYKELRYTFLDLSSALLKSQRRLNGSHKNTSFMIGHGERLPFKDESYDYIIANEIIADFRVIRLHKDSSPSKIKGLQKEAWEIIHKYRMNFDDTLNKFIFSVGAIKFLEEIKRILKPGGLAIIIEYGSDWRYPTSKPLKGHKEHTIHFGHLRHVAERLGLSVEMSDLLKFIRFKKNIKVINKCSLCLLDKILKKNKNQLHFFLTPTMLKELLDRDYKQFRNIQFANLDEGKSEFDLKFFKVMILRNHGGTEVTTEARNATDNMEKK